jgi:excinuclease ABC subunit A
VEAVAEEIGADHDEPWSKLSKKHQRQLLRGDGVGRVLVRYRNRYGRVRTYNANYEGVIPYLQRRHQESESDSQREQIEGYMRLVPCHACGGARLRPLSLAVTIDGHTIAEIGDMSIGEAAKVLEGLELSERDRLIAERVIKEINARMGFLLDVGLDYLTLSRSAATLAGGEAQRIRLASQIGSGLVGVLYVLDEPSIGLHQRDNRRLIDTLVRLRDLGNTVLVVEHDEDTISVADHVVDIGPGAGEHGGDVVHSGTGQGAAQEQGLDHRPVPGRQAQDPGARGPAPARRRPAGGPGCPGAQPQEHRRGGAPRAVGGRHRGVGLGQVHAGQRHPLPVAHAADLQLEDPAGAAQDRRGPRAPRQGHQHRPEPHRAHPRSNPATYTGVFDHVRKLFAATQEAKVRGYLPGRFSFNVAGGRCEACAGDGTIKIEMHFLPDVYVPCEVCKGKRYNRDTLDITFRDHNISDVLEMSCEEALTFFANQPAIARHMQTLVDVGLGYVRLGQPATTLSGGEAQRVKLASELAKRSTGHTIYILDEPTTGLHFEDIRKLLTVLSRLVDQGNTVLVIEHNLDVIKTADWIIDLGPEGGSGGGTVVCEGTPEDVAGHGGSWTGQFLAPLLG